VFTARYGLCLHIKCRLTLSFKAMPLLRRLVFGLSPRRHKFYRGSVDVRFFVDTVVLGQAFVSLSLSFHQCFTLISIDILLLPVGQTGEVWEPSKKQCARGKLGALDENVVLLSLWKVSVILPSDSGFYKRSLPSGLPTKICSLAIACYIFMPILAFVWKSCLCFEV